MDLIAKYAGISVLTSTDTFLAAAYSSLSAPIVYVKLAYDSELFKNSVDNGKRGGCGDSATFNGFEVIGYIRSNIFTYRCQQLKYRRGKKAGKRFQQEHHQDCKLQEELEFART